MSGQAIMQYESRAKLMLSGEYSVLKGALALALPLKYGQQLIVGETVGEPGMHWHSRIGEQLWFSAKFSIPELTVSDANLPVIGQKLENLLRMAKILNPKFLESPKCYSITSAMDFDPEWGIGSSSSLVSNIAFWAECDPYELNRRIFNGSGYDIACARATTPILFQTKDGTVVAKTVDFYPEYQSQLYFIYLNRKQNTQQSIQKHNINNLTFKHIESISTISLNMLNAPNLQTFQSLMEQHESLTGKLIGQKPVQKIHFQDFNGTVKSLGAWGGDFVLAASSESEKYVRDYFAGKNLRTIFKYSETVLKKEYSRQECISKQPLSRPTILF